jgi:protein-S-isoprenylcysteine O-methyltransferase Ste14
MKLKTVSPDGYFVTAIILSVIIHNIFPLRSIIFYPYTLAGIALIIAGILIVLVTNSVLIKNSTSIHAFEMPGKLVDSGPFSFSRNPIYVGMTIILFGVEIILGSLLVLIIPILFVIVMNIFIIPAEENIMEILFGEQYLAYKNKVRRWI